MDTMLARSGPALHYADLGSGRCVLALHGAYSAHEEIRAIIEPVLAPRHAYRRLYPDLPGMGATPAHDAVRTSNDVVDLLDELMRSLVGDDRFLVVGQSYGAHLARGLAARHPRQVAGLALICPPLPDHPGGEPHVVVRTIDDPARMLDPEMVGEYAGYLTVQTPETAIRFREAVAPALGRWDGAAVERVLNHWRLDPDPDSATYDGPTLVLAARHDSFVGYREQLSLLDRYPRAWYVAVADAGHALPHEHPDLVGRLLDAWLAQI